MKILITKGKLLKGDNVSIEYTETDSDGNSSKGSKESATPPAKSMKDAFASLAVHVALLGYFIKPSEIDDVLNPEHEELKNFTVTGFSIHLKSKTQDMEGVTLTAHRILPNGKALGFNTPICRFEDESDNAYEFAEDLLSAVQLAQVEMEKYLNGHHAPPAQLKMDLPDADEPLTKIQFANGADSLTEAEQLELMRIPKATNYEDAFSNQ